LWTGDTYVIAKQGTVEFMNLIDISEVGEDLRFISATGNELLSRQNGKYKARQVQAMRQLTESSATLLMKEWYRENSIESTLDYLDIYEDEKSYSEGSLTSRTSLQRNRSKALIHDAKAKFRATHDGQLFCEVCGFNFDQFYGIDYIEAHHTEPIATLDNETKNSVEAVVMLCANCHRAAHTRTPPYSVDELRKLMKQD
ncbi:MAG: HNH endonuclease, partial [Phototrophicaceae bacterium]